MNATPLLSALSLIQRSPFCFQLCSSRKKVIFPQKALNSQNKWMWDMFVMIYWWCSRWSIFQLDLIWFKKWIYSYGSLRFVVNVDNFTQSVEVDECQVWPSSVIIFSSSSISPTPTNLLIQRVWDEIFIILMTGLWLWRRGRWKLWILSLQRKPGQRSWKHVLQVRSATKCKNVYRTALIVS